MNALPGLSHETSLLVFALLAVIGLVVLIARFKLNAFVALILASVFVRFCSGLELTRIGQGFAVPKHICPTVALYNEAVVVDQGQAVNRWVISARARRLEI